VLDDLRLGDRHSSFLEGSIQPETVIDLSSKHGIELPDFDEPGDLYDYPDIYEFLKMYDIAAHSVRDHDDFRRVTYETLEEAAKHNVRYREMFWSPSDSRRLAAGG
jgi:adenosine deaminase